VNLDGPELHLRPLVVADASALLDLRVREREFLAPFEPVRNDRFFTLEAQREQIEQGLLEWAQDRGYGFGVFPRGSKELIGRVALSNIVRGAWQNATLGYFIASSYNGRGLASQAVGLAVGYAFSEVKLHRVQAGVMPRNEASAKVLINNGFRLEGRAPRYLQINGVWEDHDLYALTVEDRA
jgi:[ribosomal protein S5]-alanine N-acetyltransferase